MLSSCLIVNEHVKLNLEFRLSPGTKGWFVGFYMGIFFVNVRLSITATVLHVVSHIFKKDYKCTTTKS